VNYADARPSIRSGDLIAWGRDDAPRTLHDWEVAAVQGFTRSTYSHVGVALLLGPRVFVIEAVVPRVQLVPLSALLPAYWFAGEIRIEWTDKAEDEALRHIGRPYSKWEAIKAFFGRVKVGDNAVTYCAELAAQIRGPLLVEEFPSPTPASLVKNAMRRGAQQHFLTREA
jgi:hypothetical protein